MNWAIRFFKKTDQAHREADQTDSDYFNQATHWADDLYLSALISRRRYQWAFLVSFGLSALLVVLLLCVLPLQKTQLVVVHEGVSGNVWVSTELPNSVMPFNESRTRSEIANYVRTRESYDPILYRYQSGQVNLFSSGEVSTEYAATETPQNPSAPINFLAAKGYRTVTIKSVLFLDESVKDARAKNHHSTHSNLAQVNFVVTDHFFGASEGAETPYTALVAWEYRGVPKDPNAMLLNWDGFTVTRYQVQPVNVT
ncbi:MAG: hypothetical protein EBX40_06935 [Gammaproteobacteria bacterium]|nr:hypothetical protein [Gammaproteobacteria bacterium]